MAVSVVIDKNDLKVVRQRLARQLEIMKNLQTPLSKIATQMYQSVMTNFREEGTDKRKWQPLSWWTIWLKKIRKGKRTQMPKILQDTGYLRNSIYPEVGENFAIVGTNVSYAKLHQFGGVSSPNAVEIGNFHRNFPSIWRGKEISEETIAKRKRKDVLVHGFTMMMKGGHKIPPRPFITLRQKNLEAIKNIARLWFREGKA
jgi:phage virion morphogenesis protein